jgi:hypothetical protein
VAPVKAVIVSRYGVSGEAMIQGMSYEGGPIKLGCSHNDDSDRTGQDRTGQDRTIQFKKK